VLTPLMHCLPSTAGLTLGLSQQSWPRLWLTVIALSAFSVSPIWAQSTPERPATAETTANAKRGLAIYTAKCSACHSVDEDRVGPAHAGVFGRRVGKAKGYEYSEALRKSTIVWNKTTLNAWLTDPEKLIPGQRMGYRLSLPQERADVIAYLASLSAPK
jgi:cytochrome c